MAHHPRPPELEGVSEGALLAYARELAVSIAAAPDLAAALTALPAGSLGPASVATAYAAAWDAAHGGADGAPAGPTWALAFAHACAALGCREPGCALCAHNPRRVCVSALANKCLAGDGFRAACGAAPRLDVLWVGEGEPPRAGPPPGVAVELCVLDGKQYGALLDAGRGGDAAAAASCVLRLNNAGGPLLVRTAKGQAGGGGGGEDGGERGTPGPGASPGGGVLVDLAPSDASSAPLSAAVGDLAVTGSSESLLSGQRPPFRLLARAVDARTGAPAPGWAFAVSDPFVAATPRVRTAIKADIPSLDDHVSKLNAVGPQTQAKLAALGAEAGAAGVTLALPHASVTTVGQFRDVAALAAADPALTEALKRVLKLTKGWEAACDHAFAAVEPDARARVWYEAGPLSDGLVFRADRGAPDLSAPLGLLWRPKPATPGGGAWVTPLDRVPPARGGDVGRMAGQAAACWAAPGHPGWAVWEGVESGALASAAAAADVTVEPPSTAAAAARSAAASTLGGPSLSALPRPSLLATGAASGWGGFAVPTGAPPAPLAAPAAGPGGPRKAVPPSPFAVADDIPAPAPSGAAAAAAAAIAAGAKRTAADGGGGAPKRARAAAGPSIDAAALRERLSTLAGRALSGLDMARLIPGFPTCTPSDELFAATGLQPLDFSPSEALRLGGGAGTGAAPPSPRAGSGALDESLLRFLNARLGIAPGSGLTARGGGGGGSVAGAPAAARPSSLRPAPASRGLANLPSLGGASLSDLPTLPSAMFAGLASLPVGEEAAADGSGGGGEAHPPPPAAAATDAKKKKASPAPTTKKAPSAKKAGAMPAATRRSSRGR